MLSFYIGLEPTYLQELPDITFLELHGNNFDELTNDDKGLFFSEEESKNELNSDLDDLWFIIYIRNCKLISDMN